MDGDFSIQENENIEEYISMDNEEFQRRMMYDPGPLREIVKKAIADGIIIPKPKWVN